METIKYLTEYYSQFCDEDSRLSSRSGSVEFMTTMHYIERYIKPGDRIMEIGAGTGKYSHAIARKGYDVDAVELIEHNIEVFRKNTQTGEKITIKQGNALDLADFSNNTYDMTLLLGPMYHLYAKKDKLVALNEAIRVTKQGGLIFVAYCISDAILLLEFFKTKKFDINDYINKGMVDPLTFSTKSEPKDIIELVRKENIDELMSGLNVTRLHYVATDGYAHHMGESIDVMSDYDFEMFLKYHYATCEREDMVGISNHVVDIFRKNN